MSTPLRDEYRRARRLFAESRVPLLVVALGAGMVCALAVVFAKILDNVLDGDGVTAWDLPVSRWCAEHREPVLTTVMRALTEVGNPPVLAALTAAAMVVVMVRGRSLAPVVLGAFAFGGYLMMVVTVKLAVERPRPPLPERAIAANGSSFPSGHAAGVAAVALVSVWLITREGPKRRWIRAIAWTTAFVLIAAVGFSRVYLGVHYPSDIVAGWVLGAGWAGVLFVAGTAATPLWRGHSLGRRHCRP
ncbi:phosphatase PAP2 family protein [Nocardia sp. ET3-3]|uniref:Phosphatase PAP2 family protein n=1 Tax=Nocardia terrae TaxID=2675851 RepID=A0A7K1UVH7_9NOCA|nr:phosphatase PAP2 family protein [Nocardia terrae]MVU78307.1 phosphatase PAP2 family protein [Nocardia terrae]